MKYSRALEAAFRKFKLRAIVLVALLFIAAILLAFYCEYNLPYYSENNAITYKGYCNSFGVYTDNYGRYRSAYAWLEMDYGSVYSIPVNAVYDYRYDEDKFKELLSNRLLTVTCSTTENRHGYKTILKLEADGTEIISANDICSAFKPVRGVIWAIYLISVAALCLVVWQRSADAAPVIKDKLRAIKEKLKLRRHK